MLNENWTAGPDSVTAVRSMGWLGSTRYSPYPVVKTAYLPKLFNEEIDSNLGSYSAIFDSLCCKLIVYVAVPLYEVLIGKFAFKNVPYSRFSIFELGVHS